MPCSLMSFIRVVHSQVGSSSVRSEADAEKLATEKEGKMQAEAASVNVFYSFCLDSSVPSRGTYHNVVLRSRCRQETAKREE